MDYRKRIADSLVETSLKCMGAVLIEGTKWCGKSTTAGQHCKSAIYMDDPARRSVYEILADDSISLIIDGETPRLIDEWQINPKIWDAVRHTVDRRHLFGQFILTGSAKPTDRSKIYHSGAGRFSWIKMRPMSLLESGDSSGAVSLSALFSGARLTPVPAPQSDLAHIAFLCCRGGWPTSTFLPPELALRPAVEYYNAVVNVDINQVGGVSRSTERAKKLMRSYARFQGTQTPLSQIVADMNGPDAAGSSEKTVASYLDALAAMFVIEEMPAWNPNLKSRTAIRTAPTRYFVDPSIAAASLGIGPRDLMNDLKAFGLIFETLCARDLRVYSQPLDGEICHFRNKNGLECDAVVHLPNGSFGLVEVKLGGERLVNEGAENLLKLASKIDTDRMKAPSFLMVLTATGALAYQRPDGVLVVPVSTLGA